MRVWVSTRRRLSRLSVESLCLPACLLGRLSVCRGRVASETYAKLLTQKATKRNANTEAKKRSKGKAAGFALALPLLTPTLALTALLAFVYET